MILEEWESKMTGESLVIVRLGIMMTFIQNRMKWYRWEWDEIKHFMVENIPITIEKNITLLLVIKSDAMGINNYLTKWLFEWLFESIN